MELPDVIGYPLDKARVLLRESGVNDFNVIATAPPKQGITGYDDTCRVVRVRFDEENKIELVVCKPL